MASLTGPSSQPPADTLPAGGLPPAGIYAGVTYGAGKPERTEIDPVSGQARYKDKGATLRGTALSFHGANFAQEFFDQKVEPVFRKMWDFYLGNRLAAEPELARHNSYPTALAFTVEHVKAGKSGFVAYEVDGQIAGIDFCGGIYFDPINGFTLTSEGLFVADEFSNCGLGRQIKHATFEQGIGMFPSAKHICWWTKGQIEGWKVGGKFDRNPMTGFYHNIASPQEGFPTRLVSGANGDIAPAIINGQPNNLTGQVAFEMPVTPQGHAVYAYNAVRDQLPTHSISTRTNFTDQVPIDLFRQILEERGITGAQAWIRCEALTGINEKPGISARLATLQGVSAIAVIDHNTKRPRDAFGTSYLTILVPNSFSTVDSGLQHDFLRGIWQWAMREAAANNCGMVRSIINIDDPLAPLMPNTYLNRPQNNSHLTFALENDAVTQVIRAPHILFGNVAAADIMGTGYGTHIPAAKSIYPPFLDGDASDWLAH